MENEGIRVNKYIARCGYCSRRDADMLIKKTAVIVNGKPAEPGMKVTEADEISINGVLLNKPEEKTVLAYYKPRGVVCSARDRHAALTVADCLKYPKRLTYAGRLDKDSEGLLIMTNDGKLIDAMMRGANRHEKEYLVKVDRKIADKDLELMRKGIFLEELGQTTRECDIVKTGGRTMKIILTQGLNRQIRRMCEALGYKVTELKRTRVININLKGLAPGEYREIGGEELRELYGECEG